MDSLVQLAHSKAMDILYAPIEIDEIPPDQRGGMMDALGLILDGIGGKAATSALGFGLSASYRMKDLRSEGVTRLSFRKADTRSEERRGGDERGCEHTADPEKK